MTAKLYQIYETIMLSRPSSGFIYLWIRMIEIDDYVSNTYFDSVQLF